MQNRILLLSEGVICGELPVGVAELPSNLSRTNSVKSESTGRRVFCAGAAWFPPKFRLCLLPGLVGLRLLLNMIHVLNTHRTHTMRS